MTILTKIDSKIERVFSKLQYLANNCEDLTPILVEGRLHRAIGTILEAYLWNVRVGDLCIVQDANISLYAEVVAIDGQLVKLLPYGSINQLSKNALISKVSTGFTIKVGDYLLGQVVDGFGRVLSSILPVRDGVFLDKNISASAPDPLKRPIITQQLLTGVKVIDVFVSCGIGQRLAIFASPGMGKTTLIGMILRNTSADVIVIALIGERGREVQEFIELEMNEECRRRCIVVIATSDQPPVEQVKAAYVAQTIAEYFRDQGKNVILFIDSVTRFARAQREIGLSSGEPVTRGGFPPSVFLAFPKLMERAGCNEYGSITAFYTVLMQNELTTEDPIADEVKSIVDGHIVLSRKLVEHGHFPAVDILSSLSRVADRIIETEHLQAARHIRLLLSKYEELEFLVRVGEYKPGNDALADEAIDKHDKIMKFLQQNTRETPIFRNELTKLISLVQN
jgi:type III secretion protein N (ATPase)